MMHAIHTHKGRYPVHRNHYHAQLRLIAAILLAAAVMTIAAMGQSGAESTLGELSSFMNDGG